MIGCLVGRWVNAYHLAGMPAYPRPKTSSCAGSEHVDQGPEQETGLTNATGTAANTWSTTTGPDATPGLHRGPHRFPLLLAHALELGHTGGHLGWHLAIGRRARAPGGSYLATELRLSAGARVRIPT
jgi:hypothetical protein